MTSLKERLKDGNINYFEYDDFSDIEKIGEGGFAVVERANWIDGGIEVVLKTIEGSTIDEENVLKEVIKEVINTAYCLRVPLTFKYFYYNTAQAFMSINSSQY
jgi:serine/threonine protein kinase